ncbi:transposase domain-containing protein [Streptococcus danieliae]
MEIIKKQAATNQSLTEENSLLREQVAYLTQKLYGKSSEKNTVQPGQMSLFGEEETPNQEDSDLPR